MATKAGVWIDHKQAVVVLTTDAGTTIKKFQTDAALPKTAQASSRTARKFTPNDFVAEDRRDRKLTAARKQVFEAVLTHIRGADALLILGPGEAKGEFSKHIQAKKIRGVVVECETADKLTDRQIAATVQQHFAANPAKKTAAPTKSAAPKKPIKSPVKKAAKAVAAKRSKTAKK